MSNERDPAELNNKEISWKPKESYLGPRGLAWGNNAVVWGGAAVAARNMQRRKIQELVRKPRPEPE